MFIDLYYFDDSSGQVFIEKVLLDSVTRQNPS